MDRGGRIRWLDAAWALAVGGLSAALAVVLRRWRHELRQEQRFSQRAQVETFEAGRMRDHLLASASHDLKTPLASIKLLVHLLKRDAHKGPIPPQQLLSRLEVIESNLNRISAMINELLDVARLQGGKPLPLHLADTDLVSLARKVAESPQGSSSKHRIVVDAREPALLGCWDANRLERVIQNLVNNGITYSPAGGDVTIRLSKDCEHGAPMAALSVIDEGMGVPIADQAHVFEWFRRGGNVEHIAGTGVGLASAKQIVEKHGGTLSLSSSPGKGSTFTLRLPLEPAAAQRGEPIPPAVGQPAGDRE